MRANCLYSEECFDESLISSRVRVPHISLVFREMWDTTALRLKAFVFDIYKVKIRGIPHLAKNERDVGHPCFVARRSKRLLFPEGKMQWWLRPLFFPRTLGRTWGTRRFSWRCPALVALQAQIAVLEDCDSCGKEQRRTQDDQDETAGV